MLCTRGDPDLQGRRLDHSGLRHHFDGVYFMERKNPATFRAVLIEQGFETSTTFIVGDGVRSDINPALELGAHAVLVRGQNWEHERIDPLHADFAAVDLPVIQTYFNPYLPAVVKGVTALADDFEGALEAGGRYGSYYRNAHLWDKI